MTKSIPVPPWLYAPPDGPEPRPPVEVRGQALPFEELSWKDFERLILRIVRREGAIVDCSLYGTPGQAQDGFDILATHREHQSLRVCYQCKKVAEFGPVAIIAAVDKFLSGEWADKTCEFVLCLATSLESTQQQDELDRQRTRLSARGIKLSVWDGAPAGALCDRLKRLPELVDDFFSRPWVEKFNGCEAAASLRDRLNGYELGALRCRLLKLYSVIFAQHDPGLRTDGDRSVDYRDRYVPANVTEWAEATVGSADMPSSVKTPGDSGAGTESGAHGMEARPLTVRSTAYEARRPVLEWLQDQQDCVVLGEPGYGKSALLRYLALSILQPETTAPEALNPSYFSRLPVWISFARLSSAIDRQSGMSVEDFFLGWLHQHSFDDVYPLFARAVRGAQVLVLLDGLDEATTESSGRETLDRIVTFLDSCSARIICTSRPRGYKALGVPRSWSTATLISLSDEKIALLATRWFAIVESGVEEGAQGNPEIADQLRARAQAFLRAAKANPKTLELARSPLLCQVLIQLFRFSHRLPEARVTAYQQIVDLLLSRHPAARAQAGGIAQPAERLGLKTADIKEVLVRLAWELQEHEHAGHLSRAQCEQHCSAFLEDDTFGLGLQRAQARRNAAEVIEQLVTHYGVLVERAPGELNFVHLSIQEYLAAELITRKMHDDQLRWLSDVWPRSAWRESLISWFGILGARGDKVLSGRASQRLAALGEIGEWQRMQSLELRAEIATADLGLPVSEARRVIEQATREVEVSAFPEFRTTLARSITLGALGSLVRSECQAAVRRWMPGQSAYTRLRLLQTFKTWEPSNVLRGTLLRALHDEDGRCRRAASEAFAALVFASEDALPALKQLAVHHVQPEVRAAALHGLGIRPEWAGSAAEAAAANIGSCNADLLLVASQARIRQGLHDDTDLDRVWRLWKTDAVDFWFRDELVELFCIGWPRHPGVRKALIQQLEDRSTRSGVELPLEYLMRCYPDDEEIAEILARLFEINGKHFSSHPARLWGPMRMGYKSHPVVSLALRAMLKKYREEFAAIFWHPDTVPAFAVLGDDEARDDLLSSYETADFRGRYWIATALFAGWSNDEIVRGRLKDWVSGPIAMAASLVRWGADLVPDAEQRHAWLRRIASESGSTREIDALMALLKEFPDIQTKQLAEGFLEDRRLWYYHRMSLQGLFASKFPDDPKSLEILERSLGEIDGPNPGDFAASFQRNPEVAGRLLAAAVTAPTDVRMTVASVLRDRAAEYDTVVAMTPQPFAEESSAVRASCLMARAQAARGRPGDAEDLAEALALELAAIGSDMDKRRRSALAGLLELGLPERAVAVMANEKNPSWAYRLVDQLDGDPVSIGAVIEHWSVLQPLLLQHKLESDLPVSEIVYAGYDALLEQTSLGREALDKYFETQSRDWINSAYFEVFARRQSRSAFLRERLLAMVGTWQSPGMVACTAARLLAQNFVSLPDIWTEISGRLGAPEHAIRQVAFGVLGYLVLGWPDGVLAAWVRSVPPGQRAQWSPRDRLLIGIALNDPAAAEAAATDMLAEPLQSWRFHMEDTHALRIWSQSDESSPVLARWIESDNPSLSATALSLVANGHTNVGHHADKLVERFNDQLVPTGTVPSDGLNAATGRHVSWAVSVYADLNPRFPR